MMKESVRREAHKEQVDPTQIDYLQSDIDGQRVDAIVAYVRQVGKWNLPPVLGLEDLGNGAPILDGYHRVAAARILQEDDNLDIALAVQTIPAWIVSDEDCRAILDAHFDGELGSRLSDLDDYILIKGVTYSELEIR